LLDGAGHRITNTFERARPAPTDLAALTALRGVVPSVAVVHGASAGHGALCAPLCDVVIMVEGQGQLFTAGPPLVAAATGEVVDKETLGGSEVHLASGVAHLGAADDGDALALVRRWLAALHDASSQDGARRVDELLTLIPANQRRGYDIRPVAAAVFDRGSVLELSDRYGTGMITALARLDGRAVAVVANQPAVRAGAIDVPGADKATRFIEFASRHRLPLVLMADNPGVLPGVVAERAGALRAAADLFATMQRHDGPKLHVTLRKAYGFGSSVMGHNPFSGQTVTLALPGATVGAMPAQGGSDAAHVDDGTRTELAAHEADGPWRQADMLSYDDVVHPGELRNALVDALRLSSGR
jgi:acetyl-CoA carboxylase carboxyltransferase component